MKKYNVDIPYDTEYAINRANKIKQWLYENGIAYESSSIGGYINIDIYATPEIADKIRHTFRISVWEVWHK